MRIEMMGIGVFDFSTYKKKYIYAKKHSILIDTSNFSEKF